jgi:hypothetical protein
VVDTAAGKEDIVRPRIMPIRSIMLLLGILGAMARPASGAADIRLDFTVSTEFRTLKYLEQGAITNHSVPLNQPVVFDMRVVLDPTFRSFQRREENAPSPTWIMTETYFEGVTAIGSSPFGTEMSDYNVFGFTDLTPSPWYHFTRGRETLFAPDLGHAGVNIAFALYGIRRDTETGQDDMYHHIISFSGNNPLFAPSVADDMTPWTTEEFLDFIRHDQTVWGFAELARAETYLDPAQPTWTFYDEVVYQGPASLTSVTTVPTPPAIGLAAFGLLGVLAAARRLGTV